MTGYKDASERPFHSHHLYLETVVAHPVERVWPAAIDLPAWAANNHRYETIAGNPGELGHLFRLWPLQLNERAPTPRYHLAAVAKVIPLELFCLEVFPEQGGTPYIPADYRGFDNFVFTDLGDATKITILNIGTSRDVLEVGASEEQRLAAFQRHFDNLRRLVDERTG
jgi:hypothetical protein